MTLRNCIELKAPYLIFIGDTTSPLYAKTGLGIIQWRRDLVAGQLRFEGNDLDMGVPDLTIAEAVAAGVKSIIIGVAPVGGCIGDDWISMLVEAAAAGLDVVSGLHKRLADYPGMSAAAEKAGASLIDVRKAPDDLPIGTGIKRSGKRVLMVGTDCAVGKKYSALALTDCLKNRGGNATFRATGQTGIMIAGKGLPIDCIIADFVSGAAEVLSPDNDPDHWDVIEGQGSLFNASYAGVSLSLLHGSQPDAIVVCHDPCRTTVSSCPGAQIPSIEDCIDLHLRCGTLTNPAIKCVGISVNTSQMDESERQPYLDALSAKVGLPCIDPILNGCDAIADRLDNI
ncbi:MAG: DUF1611 domain-containing protein [Kordiimonadaceae bacterium]|nr:DUF1611 domain-containing protein [Kordiimonadaceae bacterium]